ncbi:uncharacterized protein L199_005990 [Kwoniella botswanensis]|uniref:uncharacterized protein n=1 Tax=Kwoniella botswanensis TaxID=1268659 RepID=UPI00315C9F5E
MQQTKAFALPRGSSASRMFENRDIISRIASFADTPTQATLMRVSSLFNDTTPLFLYREITFTRRSSSKFLQGCAEDFDILERKLAYCQFTKIIVFADLPSPRFYLYARDLYDVFKSMGSPSLLFPQVDKIIFSACSITELGVYKDKHEISHPFLEILPKLTQPSHMCATCPIFTAADCSDYIRAFVPRPPQEDPMFGVRCFAFLGDRVIPHEVSELCFLFQGSVHSLILHQVGTKLRLPSYFPVTKVFFRSCACEGEWCEDNPIECQSHTGQAGRKNQLLALTYGMTKDRSITATRGLENMTQTITLVNPVLWRDSRKAREELGDWLTASVKGWKEEYISMEGWDDSKVCTCCQSREGS